MKRYKFKEIDVIECDNNTITVLDKSHHFRHHIVNCDIWECILRCCSVENKRVTFIHFAHDLYYECFISPDMDRLVEMVNKTQYDSNSVYNSVLDAKTIIDKTHDIMEQYNVYCG